MSELEQRLDALYVAVRDSTAVDRQIAFDVAMGELEYRPLHAEAALGGVVGQGRDVTGGRSHRRLLR